MPQVPFPHVLTFPKNNSHPPTGDIVRVVTDAPISDFLLETTVLFGQDIRYATFVSDVVLLKRPAKGNWSNWKKHPTYYELTVKEVVDRRSETMSSDAKYAEKQKAIAEAKKISL